LPRLLSILALVALALAVSDAAPATKAGALQGRVLRVISGDTLDVRLDGGAVDRVRVLGVVAPRAGSCFSHAATATTRALAGGRRVTLVSGSRRLAYVDVAGQGDLGRLLVDRGAAQVDSWGRGFSRFVPYVPVQQRAERANRGMWRACAADVAVTLEAPQDARPGDEVTYLAHVTNLGPLPATRVALELRPPDSAVLGAVSSTGGKCADRGWLATCAFGTIPRGTTVTGKFTVRLTTAGLASTRVATRFVSCLRAGCARRPLHDSNLENNATAALTIVTTGGPGGKLGCHPSYPTVCSPPPPPDLNCADIPFRNFRVLRDIPDADPHDLDGNHDGIGCTFDDY
jgi:uncharacterized repeat protein (TIGR01451 family)